MRAADDFAAIRARMEELQRERRQLEPAVRDWKDDPPDLTDRKRRIEEAKKIIVRARFTRD